MQTWDTWQTAGDEGIKKTFSVDLDNKLNEIWGMY